MSLIEAKNHPPSPLLPSLPRILILDESRNLSPNLAPALAFIRMFKGGCIIGQTIFGGRPRSDERTIPSCKSTASSRANSPFAMLPGY